MTTPTPEAIEAALKAQYLALDRGANGETALIAALAAYESAMEAAGFVRVPVDHPWQPIEEHDGTTDPVLVERDDGAVGEAEYHPDQDGWWWAGCDPTDYHDGQVRYPRRFCPIPKPPAMIAARPSANKGERG